MKKKTSLIAITTALIISACTFDNENGRFSVDLNKADDKAITSQQPAQQIVGIYRSMPKEGGLRFEEMRISKEDGKNYRVTISSVGVSEGCSFNAVAKGEYGHILIPLSLLNPELLSVMDIGFADNKATIDTSHPKHFSDLGTFCSHGGSLVGGYYKVNPLQ